MNPTPRTLERVNYLLKPETLDELLDEFQKQGMPMGSDRWAEHCLAFLRQRWEEANALRDIMKCIDDAKEKRKKALDGLYISQRLRLTKDHQARAEARDMQPVAKVEVIHNPHTKECAYWNDCHNGFDHPRNCDCGVWG
jgi:hypothetical protein